MNRESDRNGSTLRVDIDKGQEVIAILVCPFEPLERADFVTRLREDSRDIEPILNSVRGRLFLDQDNSTGILSFAHARVPCAMPILPGHWAQPYGRGQETLEQRIFAQGRASFGGIRRSLPANCGHRPSPNRQAHMNDRERWIVGNTRNLSAMPLFFHGFHFCSLLNCVRLLGLASEKTCKVFHLA